MSEIRIKRKRQVDRKPNLKVLKTIPSMTVTTKRVRDTCMKDIGYTIVHGCKIIIDGGNGSDSRK